MVQGTSFESSSKAFQKNRDGRGVYLALCQHNLGSSKWDKIIDEAETYVMRREWNGKNIRFTVRSHISKHREAHNEMMRASQFAEYELPNDHTRIGRLMKSIISREPAIVSAITHIQGSQLQRNDFEAAADFLLLTAPKPKEHAPRHCISAINTNKPKRKGFGDTGFELRYHSKYEYNKLSKAQKKELSAWRKDKENFQPSSQKVSALEQQLIDMRKETQAMRATIAALSPRNEPQENNQTRQPLTNPLTQRVN